MKIVDNKHIKWHLLAWFVYFIINFYSDIFYEEWTFAASVFLFSYFFLTIFTFYLFYYFVAPRLLKTKLLIFIPLFFALLTLLRYFVQEYFIFLILGYNNTSINQSAWEFINDNFFRDFILITMLLRVAV